MELVGFLGHNDPRWVFGFPYTFALLVLAQMFQLFGLSSAVMCYTEGADVYWAMARGALAVMVICQLLGAMLRDPESFWKKLVASGFSYGALVVGIGDPRVSTSPRCSSLISIQLSIYFWSTAYIVGLFLLMLANKVLWVGVSLCSPKLYLRLHGVKSEKEE